MYLALYRYTDIWANICPVQTLLYMTQWEELKCLESRQSDLLDAQHKEKKRTIHFTGQCEIVLVAVMGIFSSFMIKTFHNAQQYSKIKSCSFKYACRHFVDFYMHIWIVYHHLSIYPSVSTVHVLWEQLMRCCISSVTIFKVIMPFHF